MKVHIYTDIASLFGQACRIWMTVLVEAGHEVELVDMGMTTDKPLPAVGTADLNLLVTGIFAFERFKAWGLPARGKNVLWMFDPLTQQREATMHSHKWLAFDAIAAQLDAVIAMDASIASYVRTWHPTLPTLQIPYLVAEQAITKPLAESERNGQVLLMGGHTPRRAAVEEALQGVGVATEFLWAGVWGAERHQKRQRSRISLNIHADPVHTYFDQFRTLEAWAAGTVVVTESTDGLQPWGVVPGVHLAMADLNALPPMCVELLADAPRRAQMTREARDLLRAQFSPKRWRQDMLSIL
ncbi:MAG TPA: glycosyltransferase [Polaromonas sp.]|uniref:glycosyltransferase family protein n=1 Tax=Polaromonas sp. TaxID=1869339 RepID=UPI002D5DAE48|nr:glycosyltransferase [Polaromonas sp.]HYW57921.1 glycosyltransferase [Polaromonas sp.]